MHATPPTLSEIQRAATQLTGRVRRTPTWAWNGVGLERRLTGPTQVILKLELLQHAGSFKPRGALLNMLDLSPEQRVAGVTAVSAGNHAMAVGYAAAALGTTAKVVMPRSADASRVARCRDMGTEVVLVDDVHAAFAEVERIEAAEGRTFIHPFEGPRTALGTATVGLELVEDSPIPLDAVIIPIGGGGLCAGMAAAVKAMLPACAVFGVEPVGADTMHRSFAAGSPQAIDGVHTIADSLGAPHAAPYSFSLCQQLVDDLVKVDDDALCAAMALLRREMKLAVEPAAAASTAALLGPLRDRMSGKRVGLIVCGANLDHRTYAQHIERGEALLAA
jgi:threonine dehydratase